MTTVLGVMAKIFALISFAFILIFGAGVLPYSKAQTKPACGIELGGIIRTPLDQHQFCKGSDDGQKAADNDFQHHAKFNDSPSQSAALNRTAAYNEGYAISYGDEWSILKNG